MNSKKATSKKLKDKVSKIKQAKSKFPPTEEQQAILDAAQGEARVLMIEAGAGTGKTTTDRMLVDVLTGNGQYTAFNSSLVADAKSKFLGTRCACNTTHSLAFQAEGKNYSHRLEGRRVRSDQIARMLGLAPFEYTMPGDEKVRKIPTRTLASYVMGAIRRFCQSADRTLDGSHFRYVDGIDQPDADGRRTYATNEALREYLLPYAEQFWADVADPDGQFPFTHDHYVKLWQLNHPVINADYILLDEAQDTAPVMLDILRQQEHAKIILVGDSAQQIYEWRGAVNALAAFPDAPRLLLSQSFRFGKAIADVANRVLDTLEEATPLRLRGFDKIPSRVEYVADPDCILCRTNAVAVSSLLAALAEGKRAFLVGGGSNVLSFVKAALELQQGQQTSHPELACFNSWAEVQEYSKMDDGEDLQLMVKLIDGFGARVIIDALEAMPTEAEADLVISTAHKSKGREWDRVVLASDFPVASKSNDSDRKLLYVAVTRAKLSLDITGCPFFTGEDALDLSEVIAAQPKPHVEDEPVVPPTPSTPPPTEFTWARNWDDKSWAVRGPSGHEGTTVDVFRRDGSSSKKHLRSALKTFSDGATLYQV